MSFHFGHIPDAPEVVAARLGLHLHHGIGAMRAAAQSLPLKTSNRQKLLPSLGGPGILNQNDTETCFPAGTPVLMADGTERPIEDVGDGNEVRTHNGKRRRVVQTMRRQYDGRLYAIELHGFVYPTTMTDNHPVGVVRDSGTGGRTYQPGELEWVPAKDVKPGDWVLMPSRRTPEEPGEAIALRVADFIEEDCLEADGSVRCFSARRTSVIPAKIVADELFAQLLGLFLAEGCYLKNSGLAGGLVFTFARHEREYQSYVVDALFAKFGVLADLHETGDRSSVTDVVVRNETLAKFFHGLCGEGALTKHLPMFLHASPLRVKLAALKGWLQGDGTQNALASYDRSVSISGCTSSRALHRGLFRLALDCGLKPGCQRRAQEVHQNAPSGTLSFYGNDVFVIFPDKRAQATERGVEPTGKRKNHREHNLGFVCKVKSITVSETEEPIEVFNLEVDGEHTYIANAMAVHNCEAHAHAAAITLYFAVLGKPLPELLSPVGIAYGMYTIDRPPPAPDGTLVPLFDVGSMPSSVLSALGRWGGCGASVWGQYPASSATMYVPGTTDAELIEPAPEKFKAESPIRVDGAFFVQSSGLQRRIDIMSALAVGRPVSMAIPASGATFQAYRGGILRAVDLTGDVDHANYLLDYEWSGTQAELTSWLQGAPGLDNKLSFWNGNSWGEDGFGTSDVPGIRGGLWQCDVTALDSSIQDACVLAITGTT